MSVQPGTEDRPSIDFVHQNDVPFGDLMDALVGDDAAASDPGAAAAAGGAAGGTGAGVPGPDVQPPASGAPGRPDEPGARAGEAGQAGGAPDPAGAGGSGEGGQPAGEPAGGGAEQPAAAGQSAAPPAAGPDATVVLSQLGDLSTKFEENALKAYQQQAYDAAREEYTPYFDALEKHPRLLVGTEVPRIGAEGMETLKNSEDAKEWQEAVRSLLVQEIREKAEAKVEESRTFLDTVHASIDLFKNNVDLIPGTKGFNRELADAFAQMAQPYEIRDEDDKKLVGYSIPVQPIIDRLRAQIQASKTPAVSPPSQPAAPAGAPVRSATPEPPQAGLTSKAGNSSEREDFSTLFGTIGLPNLQI